MKIVCLASGGIDSSILLLMLKKDGHEILPLYINYGHKANKWETKSFRNVCEYLQIKGKEIDLVNLNVVKSGLTDEKISSIDHPTFPLRNLILTTIAASYAFNKATRIIALGFLKNSVFPDQKKDFIQKTEETISSAAGQEMKLMSPFIDMDKNEVIHLAKKYRFPLDITYSCHSGTKVPCGECMGCIERNKVLGMKMKEND